MRIKLSYVVFQFQIIYCNGTIDKDQHIKNIVVIIYVWQYAFFFYTCTTQLLLAAVHMFSMQAFPLNCYICTLVNHCPQILDNNIGVIYHCFIFIVYTYDRRSKYLDLYFIINKLNHVFIYEPLPTYFTGSIIFTITNIN